MPSKKHSQEVDLIIKAISEGFGEISKDLKQMGEDMPEKETKKFGLTFATVMTGINQGLEVGKKAVERFKKAFEFAELGATVGQTTQSFNELLKVTGTNSDMLDRMKEASNGTIDSLSAMQGVLTLTTGTSGEMQKQLTQAAPELLKIAKAAHDLNPALGSTSQLFKDINTGIKRNSPMIIDNLGIVTSATKANEAYAKELGKTVDQLTAEEKQIALLNNVMLTGNYMVEQAAKLNTEHADSLAQLTVAFEDWKNSVATATTGPVADLSNAMSKMLNKNTQVRNATAQLTEAVKAGTISQQDMYIIYLATLDSWEDWVDTAQLVADKMYEQEAASQAVAQAEGDAMLARQAGMKVMDEQTEAIVDLIAAQKEEQLQLSAIAAGISGVWTKGMRDYIDTKQDLRTKLIELKAEYLAIQQRMQELTDAGEQGGDEFARLVDKLAATGDAIRDTEGAMETATETMHKYYMQLVYTTLAADQTAETQLALAYSLGLIDEKSYQTQLELQALKTAYENGQISLEEYTTQAKAFADELAGIKDRDVTVTTTFKQIGNPPTIGGGGSGYVSGSGSGTTTIMQASGTQGQWQRVPDRYAADSLPIYVGAGEEYMVRSRDQVESGRGSVGGGEGGVNVENMIINVGAGVSPGEVRDQVRLGLQDVIRSKGG